MRWRAEELERYYYIDSFGDVEIDYEEGEDGDEYSYEFGNYFKTQEEAIKFSKIIKEILNNRSDE